MQDVGWNLEKKNAMTNRWLKDNLNIFFHLTIQVVSLVDVPEEVCDLNPIETCRYATKLVNRTRYPRYHPPHQVPHLSPAHECTLVPKEVTSTESARDKKVLDVETILIIAASKCHQVMVELSGLPVEVQPPSRGAEASAHQVVSWCFALCESICNLFLSNLSLKK